jgi:inactivated superfamily I helicase
MLSFTHAEEDDTDVVEVDDVDVGDEELQAARQVASAITKANNPTRDACFTQPARWP